MDKVAGEIMSKKLVTVRLDDSVRKAYQIMQDRKIRHLPVSDGTGEIIGILSDRDLQRAMTPKTEISRDFEEAVEFDESFLVKDFMTWPVRTVSRGVLVEEVARRMLQEKVSAFLVMDPGHVASGIITTDDLLKLLIKLLQREPDRLRISLDSLMTDFGFSAGHWA